MERYNCIDRAFAALFALFSATTASKRLSLVLSIAAAIGYLEWLLVAYFEHAYVFDARGRRIVCDFVVFWGTGRLALSGAAPSTAYNPQLQHAAQVAVVGHAFHGGLIWSYPPIFLIVAAALALLPYACALLTWGIVTATIFAGVIAKITKERIGFVAALATPWVMINIYLTQNGLLSAGLFGAALLYVDSNPMLSGFLIGLLSFKPQLGILFPVALCAGRRWRTLAWASFWAIGFNLFASAVFGFDTIPAFWRGLHFTFTAQVTHGAAGWIHLMSPYGLVRLLKASHSIGMVTQGIFASMCVVVAALYWASRLPFSLKAAMLAALTPLISPYLFNYDLAVLAVALAFLYRHRSFSTLELGLLLPLAVPILIFWLPIPYGPFVSLAVVAICVRRKDARLRIVSPRSCRRQKPQRQICAADA